MTTPETMTNNNHQEKPLLANVSLKTLPAWSAIISIGALSLSVTYDYAFLLSLGISFAEAPTTMADHIRSSLVWIPGVVIVGFILFVIELFNVRVEQGMTEEELIKSSPYPQATATFRASPYKLIKYVVLFVFFISILSNLLLGILPEKYVPAATQLADRWLELTPIIWFLLHNFFFGHERIIERTSKQFYLLFSVGSPNIFIYSGFRHLGSEKTTH